MGLAASLGLRQRLRLLSGHETLDINEAGARLAVVCLPKPSAAARDLALERFACRAVLLRFADISCARRRKVEARGWAEVPVNVRVSHYQCVNF